MTETTQAQAGQAADVGTKITGVITALANCAPGSHVDAEALGGILERHKKSIQRAVRRGELPPPFMFMGKQTWLVGTILSHLQALQGAAVRESNNRQMRLARHTP